MGVSLSQTAAAAFPDRPGGGAGTGVLVALTSGTGGEHVSHDLGSEQAVLHVRCLLGPSTVMGGEVVVMAGFDGLGDEAFRVAYTTNTRVIKVTLATGDELSATLPAGLAWHCIELMIDTVAGEAGLWIDGVSRDTVSGGLGSLTVREVWLGGLLKDTGVTGDLHLDEWVMADAYIGPVVVAPSVDHAGDPRRWLVVYNSSSADSGQWVGAYLAEHAIPFANLCGLDLSDDEVLSIAEYLELRSAVTEYLSINGLNDQVLGILLGYSVPGYVDIGGQLNAISALLYDVGSVAQLNPIAIDGPPVRPDVHNLSGLKLTSRIDGAGLDDAIALIQRSSVVRQSGLGDGLQSKVWLDPYTTPGPLVDPHIESMTDWYGGIERMLTRLPFEISASSDPGAEVQFDAISDDGFFWGWSVPDPPAGFFAEPVGVRVFCIQLHTASATGSTLRSLTPTNWVEEALAVGYAAAVGSSRVYSVGAVPLVRPFFEALRRGWTLAEAWFVSNHVLGEGLFLVGDPLMSVQMPRAGWDVHGPLERVEDIERETPRLAARDDEREIVVPVPLRPVEGQEASYVVRRVDDRGRSEAGVRSVTTITVNGLAAVQPKRQVWPAVEGWRVSIEDGRARPVIIWNRPLTYCNVAGVELEGQVDGGGTQVMQVISSEGAETVVRGAVDLPEGSIRLRWKFNSVDGTVSRSPWSMTVRPQGVSQVLEEWRVIQ